jgi:outer membrane protein assembly factor BamE (lipoprotein component of BamABCDE complex)
MEIAKILKSVSRLPFYFFIIAFTLPLSFCRNTEEGKWSNYTDLNAITSGMSKDEVEKLIGKPDSVDQDENIWFYGNKWNFVYFEQGAVGGVSADMTKGRVSEASSEAREVTLQVDASIEGRDDGRIVVMVDDKPVDYIGKFQLEANHDGSFFLSAVSEKKIFEMSARILGDKIKDHSATVNKSLLGGSGSSMFSEGFKLRFSSNEFANVSNIFILYEFNKNFGMGITDKADKKISVSGILTASLGGSDRYPAGNNARAETGETYKKISFGTFDFEQVDFCKLKMLEFTDIPWEQTSDSLYDNRIVIATLLRGKGFSDVNWSWGKWKDGPRIICMTYATKDYSCGCHVDKLYYPTKIENTFIITERINCVSNTGLTALNALTGKHVTD